MANILKNIEKIITQSGVELSVDDAVNNINDLQANKLDATAKAADSEKLDGLDSSVFARTANVPPKPSTTTPASQALAWNGSAFINVSAGKTPSTVSQAGEFLQWDGSNFVNVEMGAPPTNITNFANHVTFNAPTVSEEGAYSAGKYLYYYSYSAPSMYTITKTMTAANLATFLSGTMSVPNYPFQVTMRAYIYGNNSNPYFYHALPDGNNLHILNMKYYSNSSTYPNYSTWVSQYQYGNRVYPNVNGSLGHGAWTDPFSVQINDPAEFNFKVWLKNHSSYAGWVRFYVELQSIAYN